MKSEAIEREVDEESSVLQEGRNGEKKVWVRAQKQSWVPDKKEIKKELAQLEGYL